MEGALYRQRYWFKSLLVLSWILGLGGLIAVTSAEDSAFKIAHAWTEREVVRAGLPISENGRPLEWIVPGRRVTLQIAEESTPFVYQVFDASASEPPEPNWVAEGENPEEAVPLPGWFLYPGEVGNHTTRKTRAICDFYLNGTWTHQGPCIADSPAATLSFEVARDATMEGKTFGVVAHTQEQTIVARYLVSSGAVFRRDYLAQKLKLAIYILGPLLIVFAAGMTFLADDPKNPIL